MHELLRSGFFPEHAPGLKIAFVHDEPAAYDFYNTSVWNREHVRDKLMKQFDGFIYVSSKCRDQWLEYGGFHDKRQYYLPNTCAEERQIANRLARTTREEARHALGMAPDVVHLALVATVQPRKAQLVAVEALDELRRRQPDVRFHLHLVGRVTQPHYGAEIRSHIERRGLEDVVSIVGEVPKSTALTYIHAAHALLLTSESEAMPLVLLEAMQFGTPIVTTDVGGVSELVSDNETAMFFSTGSADELARQIETMTLNEGKRARLAAAAADRYWAGFSNDRFFKSFDLMLRELTQDRLPKVLRTPVEAGTLTSLADGLNVTLSPLTRAPEGVIPLELHAQGAPTGMYPELRSLLAALEHEAPVQRARISVPPGSSVSASLDLCLPLARMGLEVTSLRFPEGDITLEHSRMLTQEPCLPHRDLFALTQEPAFLSERVSHAETESTGGRSAALGELAKLKRTYRWRISNAIARPFLKSSSYGKARRAYRKAKAFLRDRRREHEAREKRLCVGAVFNSPMQMMAFLSLWDTRYRGASRSQMPLVALIYSTNGSRDFAQMLHAICERTGRFDAVFDITSEYSALYGGKLTFNRCVQFKKQLMRRLADYQMDTVFIAAFMSARAQKMLYESFSETTIRLFEDGIGSYVPKPIKMSDQGIVDRVSSGDCAEAHHIRLIKSVDLMLDSIPPPPQYGSDVTRVVFPELKTRSYTIDYHRFAKVLNAEQRRFSDGEALLLTQNFSDHLRGAGFTAGMEQRMNDGVIRDLVDQGYRVVIRPHPRATRDFWDVDWRSHPRVSVWNEASAYPVEVLIDYEAPPSLLVGLSSSCLFYLRDFRGLHVARYPDEHVGALYNAANDEYKQMIDLARAAIESYSTRTTHERAEPSGDAERTEQDAT